MTAATHAAPSSLEDLRRQGENKPAPGSIRWCVLCRDLEVFNEGWRPAPRTLLAAELARTRATLGLDE